MFNCFDAGARAQAQVGPGLATLLEQWNHSGIRLQESYVC